MPFPRGSLLLSCFLLVTVFVARVQAAPVESAEDAAANRAALEAHVQSVSQRVNGASAQPVAVIEQAAVLARHAEGRLEVSTGLLGLLTSDAQLAMIVGYEHARSAAKGGASQAPRRKGRPAIQRDDAAVVAGLEAAIGAGFAGDQALLAWSRLGPARSVGTPEPGGLGDVKADRQRLEIGRKWLAGPRGVSCVKAQAGGRIGEDEYADDVRARLDAWRILKRPVVATPSPLQAPSGPAPDVSSEPAAWLTYERSGGITGWMLHLSISATGQVRATESRRGTPPVEKQLGADEMTRLRGLVAQALAAPAREAGAGLGSLRDGQMRSVEIREGERSRRLTLSDGYDLFPFDGQLIQLLEGLAR